MNTTTMNTTTMTETGANARLTKAITKLTKAKAEFPQAVEAPKAADAKALFASAKVRVRSAKRLAAAALPYADTAHRVAYLVALQHAEGHIVEPVRPTPNNG